jgi:hypothetical protein
LIAIGQPFALWQKGLVIHSWATVQHDHGRANAPDFAEQLQVAKRDHSLLKHHRFSKRSCKQY